MPNPTWIKAFLIFLCSGIAASGQNPPATSREAVLNETLVPYTGPSERGVDPGTLSGKVMCGYQGWFSCEGDGADFGWFHWSKNRKQPLAPGNAKIDMWPDVSELSADERFPTGFKHADGRTAEVFSSFKRPTVLRHFEWMRDYGIDGVFVQRFPTDLRDTKLLRKNNTVLAHCREGANRAGRTYSVMYDLSGLGAGRIGEVMEDWRALRARMKITDDPAYLRHRGKPLVAVWGIGFGDGRKYTLAECRQLIDFLKNDPEVGGCSVMLGVPTGWRELNRDAAPDAALHEVLQLADVISPWTIGRYRSPKEASRHGEKTWQPDIAWCHERGLDFLPVAFPGFSWHNMHGGKFDDIPRLKGEFLWSQFVAAKRAGAGMIYVAMFDEVDEATAIFKCTDDIPAGEGAKFVTHEGLPSDHYLRLTGQGARMLRGELPLTDHVPSAP